MAAVNRKILHVLNSPRAEGTPRIVLDWLTVKNPGVQELLFLSKNGELYPTFKEHNCWQYYNEAFPLGIRNSIKLIRLVFRIVKERKPDTLICWTNGFSPWVIIGAKAAGCKNLIVHAGNFPGSSFSTFIHTNFSGWVHRICKARVICCSRYIMDSYKKILLSPSRIYSFVYNCICLDNFSAGFKKQDRTLDFIMVATLENHKDHITLLNAWKLLEDQGINYSLCLVGDGSKRAELEALSKTLGLKNVQFLGSRTDVSVLLNNSKFFVFSTTIEEGFGTVLLEALASGCKVIASDVPACAEVLENGKWGDLFEAGNAVNLMKLVMKNTAASEEKTCGFKELDAYLKMFQPANMITNYLETAGR